MQWPKNLSKIGFGAYRVSVQSEEHYHALVYALKSGINLIDTSSNYTDGDSELLIGKVLKDHPECKPFIITKGGYIQGKNLDLLDKLQHNQKALDDLVEIDSNLKHSIHPDFLESQIEQSLERMGLESIDCFLLHNPEYYFEQKDVPTSTREYYERIENAFLFLEGMVEKGRIKSYGVSSNNFVMPTQHAKCTNLHELMAIVSRITPKHHFKCIQFPFNFLETGAIENHHERVSLLELAKKNNLITLGNRPLNAFSKAGLLRLATYPIESQQFSDKDAGELLDLLLQLLRAKWKEVQEDEGDPNVEDVLSLPLIKQFTEVWNKLPTPDAVDQFYLGHLFPLIARLWGQGGVSPEESKPFYLMYETSLNYARRIMSTKAQDFRQILIKKGVIDPQDKQTLSHLACSFYLKSGVDHVLVGLRKKAYTDDLKDLF